MNEFKAFQSIQIAGLLFCNLNLIVKTPINEKKEKRQKNVISYLFLLYILCTRKILESNTK